MVATGQVADVGDAEGLPRWRSRPLGAQPEVGNLELSLLRVWPSNRAQSHGEGVRLGPLPAAFRLTLLTAWPGSPQVADLKEGGGSLLCSPKARGPRKTAWL